jgi:predicted nucleic acid-binding protein
LYVVDASVWVSRFLPADVHHGPSYRWLGEQVAQGEPVAAPLLVLAEVAGAVARRTGLSELGAHAVSLMQHLPNARLVTVDAELAQLGAQVAAALRLRGADALYVALARRLGIPLVTWDQEQRERGKYVATALTPQEALVL